MSAKALSHALPSATISQFCRVCTQSNFSSTILNYGLKRTSPYLATSPSQIQTWLSRTTNTAGTDLSLTSTPSVAGSVGQSEIASAGPVAGAGEPARVSNRYGGRETARSATNLPDIIDRRRQLKVLIE